ncbi:MAG: hypothetical protein MZV70_10895 [Desulfobacterales bacterium]|nr:hypothetical protein [Desulfobacterales bacterium]
MPHEHRPAPAPHEADRMDRRSPRLAGPAARAARAGRLRARIALGRRRRAGGGCGWPASCCSRR